MKNLFKDAQKQKEFEENGFVVIPLLGHQEIQYLLTFYHSLDQGNATDGLHVTSNMSEDPELFRKTFDEFKSVAKSKIDEHFNEWTLIYSTFLAKRAHSKSLILPHTDWTTTETNASASLWTALTDMNVDNGVLGALPGSHRFFPETVGCSPLEIYTPNSSLSKYALRAFPYLTFPSLEAGQALVFNSATIHGSLPNTTPHARIAAGFGVVLKDAPMSHHYILPNSNLTKRETFEIDEEFFFEYNGASLFALYEQGKKPDLKSLGVYRLRFPAYDFEELVEKIVAAGNTKDPLIEEKLDTLLKSSSAVSSR